MKQIDQKEALTTLSTKYNVLTKWTSFVAVEERGEAAKKGKKGTPLDLYEILRMENIDELAAMEWEKVWKMSYYVVLF